jgi:pimeloyl-ACP methyl ester carboxylesterase
MRRELVTRIVRGALFAVLTAACVSSPVATVPEDPETIVFVHGAWGGGWQFKKVEPLLEAEGYRVSRPTLTGLGDRVHLAGPDVDLSTHVEDIVNFLEFGELDDVVLVGHSYGGMVITGVADRVPHRIARLVYMDAILPENGESVSALFGDAVESMATAGGDGAEPWQLVPRWVEPGEKPPVDVPQPLRTFTEPIELSNLDAMRIPAAYILTVEAGKNTDDFDIFADRARDRGWRVVEMEGGHNPQWFQPAAFVDVLVSVVR